MSNFLYSIAVMTDSKSEKITYFMMLFLENRAIGLMSREFTNGLEDRGSISG